MHIVSLAHTCTLYRIVHTAHTAHTVFTVATPLWLHLVSFTIVWIGGRVTEYSTDVVHLTKTYKFYKTQLCKFRFKGCTLPLSAALQHISCQGVALYFNYTLPRLFVLYSLHFMYTIVLCTFHAYVPIHVHIGTGRGGVVPSGRNHCVTTFDLPKAGSGAPPICRPTPQLWKYTAYGQGRSPSEEQNRQILLI